MKVRDTLPCVKKEECVQSPVPSPPPSLSVCLRVGIYAHVHKQNGTQTKHRKPMPKDKSCAAEQKTTKKAIKTPAAGTHCD